MAGNRPWTAEEKEYLAEAWGTVSIDRICLNLGRSRGAIFIMKDKLGLGRFLDAGEYVTMNQLVKALGYSPSQYFKKSWIENRGFPARNKKWGKKTSLVVYLEEFWIWAEQNRAFLDFSKMEHMALGIEPEWVNEQRKKDFRSAGLKKTCAWTAEEDAKLVFLLKEHRYGFAELSRELGRTAGAIQRRCLDLGLRERPVKAETHGQAAAWSDEDLSRLADGIRHGESYMSISEKLGKSEKAVRGKVYAVYLTEKADRVRSMMGNGSWGDGAPEPNVRQALKLSNTRTEVKRNLGILDALLRRRMNELGYDGYWQRFMCMKWDDVKGCTAGCSECDSCSEFLRIRPQYCARCGATFVERKENRFCEKCRTARKKQAQRHWCRVNAQ